MTKTSNLTMKNNGPASLVHAHVLSKRLPTLVQVAWYEVQASAIKVPRHCLFLNHGVYDLKAEERGLFRNTDMGQCG